MSYYDDLMAHYKAVRARLDGPPPAPWRQPPTPDPKLIVELAIEIDVELETEIREELKAELRDEVKAEVIAEIKSNALPAPPFTMPPQAARRIAQTALVPHGMTLDQAMGPSRTAPYIAARAAVYAALRKHGWSLKKIAIFCRRDHTTVLNALQPKDRTK
jgi:hypothetical protein